MQVANKLQDEYQRTHPVTDNSVEAMLFHNIAVFQLIIQRYNLFVYFCPYATVAHARVYFVSKIQRSGTGRQLILLCSIGDCAYIVASHTDAF